MLNLKKLFAVAITVALFAGSAYADTAVTIGANTGTEIEVKTQANADTETEVSVTTVTVGENITVQITGDVDPLQRIAQLEAEVYKAKRFSQLTANNMYAHLNVQFKHCSIDTLGFVDVLTLDEFFKNNAQNKMKLRNMQLIKHYTDGNPNLGVEYITFHTILESGELSNGVRCDFEAIMHDFIKNKIIFYRIDRVTPVKITINVSSAKTEVKTSADKVEVNVTKNS